MAPETDQVTDRASVILTGASSQIGVFAIPRLLEAGFRVLAVSRKGKPAAYPVFDSVEWLSEEEAHLASDACQYLISAGPLELAQNFITRAENLTTAVVFSSSSVDTKQNSINPAESFQIESMLTLETGIRALAERKGLNLAILRPTLIYGCGLDSNISRLAGWIRRFGFMPVNGAASGLRQPVHADDLAAAAVAAMQSHQALPPVLYLAGGSTLAYSEMVNRIFTALGKPARLIRLPEWFFVFLVKVASTLKAGDGINSEMVRRQGTDLVFDDRQARELLDYRPRPFKPGKEDFSLPGLRSVKSDRLPG